MVKIEAFRTRGCNLFLSAVFRQPIVENDDFRDRSQNFPIVLKHFVAFSLRGYIRLLLGISLVPPKPYLR